MKIYRLQFAGDAPNEVLVLAPTLKAALHEARSNGEHREPASIQRLVGKVLVPKK